MTEWIILSKQEAARRRPKGKVAKSKQVATSVIKEASVPGSRELFGRAPALLIEGANGQEQRIDLDGEGRIVIERGDSRRASFADVIYAIPSYQDGKRRNY